MGPLQASTPFIVLGFSPDWRNISPSQQAIHSQLVYYLGALMEAEKLVICHALIWTPPHEKKKTHPNNENMQPINTTKAQNAHKGNVTSKEPNY